MFLHSRVGILLLRMWNSVRIWNKSTIVQTNKYIDEKEKVGSLADKARSENTAVNEDWTPSSHLVPLGVSQIGHLFVFPVKTGWRWTRRSYSVIMAWQIKVVKFLLLITDWTLWKVDSALLAPCKVHPNPKLPDIKTDAEYQLQLQLANNAHHTLCGSVQHKPRQILEFAAICKNCNKLHHFHKSLPALIAHAVRQLQCQQCRIILWWNRQRYTRTQPFCQAVCIWWRKNYYSISSNSLQENKNMS